MKIIIDIETAALDDAASYLDLAEIKAPANYKDEAKIAAYVEAAKAEALNKAALDFDLARITAIGIKVDDGPHRCVAGNR